VLLRTRFPYTVVYLPKGPANDRAERRASGGARMSGLTASASRPPPCRSRIIVHKLTPEAFLLGMLTPSRRSLGAGAQGQLSQGTRARQLHVAACRMLQQPASRNTNGRALLQPIRMFGHTKASWHSDTQQHRVLKLILVQHAVPLPTTATASSQPCSLCCTGYERQSAGGAAGVPVLRVRPGDDGALRA